MVVLHFIGKCDIGMHGYALVFCPREKWEKENLPGHHAPTYTPTIIQNNKINNNLI